MEYKIQLLWDNEASVWVATSTDVPGLVLESGSFDALIERVRYAIPELLELNKQKAPFYNLTFLSERPERVDYSNRISSCVALYILIRFCISTLLTIHPLSVHALINSSIRLTPCNSFSVITAPNLRLFCIRVVSLSLDVIAIPHNRSLYDFLGLKLSFRIIEINFVFSHFLNSFRDVLSLTYEPVSSCTLSLISAIAPFALILPNANDNSRFV